VCLLSLALKGEKQLLPEAFQHYHQAVSSSIMSLADLRSDRLIYLHFLLLVYDICYATHCRNSPHNGSSMSMWVQHIGHLLRIVAHRQGRFIQQLPAYLAWYVLFLDIQASVAGNGSGSFVQAYAAKELQLPDWSQLMAAHVHGDDDATLSQALYGFTNAGFEHWAELAILAQRLRSEAAIQDVHGLDPHVLSRRQHSIMTMRSKIFEAWRKQYPTCLPSDFKHVEAHLPLHLRVLFQFVSHHITDDHALFDH
jgi:hypothetical protein